MDDKTDIAKIIADMANAQAHAVRVGCQITEQRYGRSIRALRLAFEAAQLDPNVKIPSVLTATILALFALHQQDQVNLYANAMIRRDQEQPKWERDSRQGAKDTDARYT